MIVAWDVYESETGELASALVSRAVLAERCSHTDLVLHADNGDAQKSSTLRATLDRLGLRSSFSRPLVSDDNAFIESLFRTAKYRPGFPVEGFATNGAARAWVLEFVRWYNKVHKHGAVKFVTPSERHDGRNVNASTERQGVHADARKQIPHVGAEPFVTGRARPRCGLIPSVRQPRTTTTPRKWPPMKRRTMLTNAARSK